MELSNNKMQEYSRRLMLSRMRILQTHGFYGLLLMHMRFAVDPECQTASTDGTSIFFAPQFLDDAADAELDFMMMHQILHVALQHISRGKEREGERFRLACDIVVNAHILSSAHERGAFPGLSTKDIPHLTPDGREGHLFTAEEIYEMLSCAPPAKPAADPKGKAGKKASAVSSASPTVGMTDDHSRWKGSEEADLMNDLWTRRINHAATAMQLREKGEGAGLIPLGIERLLKHIRAPQVDWRTVLNEFIQQEITDYSFAPPDKRFDDGVFLLPSFSEKDETVRDVLFMIDTSGSMSDGMITAAFSEIQGAIAQHNGHLRGWLGFFDADVIPPREFESSEELSVIRPSGGGGTDFAVIFEYVAERMRDEPPSMIIIMTDGCAAFPDEAAAMDIPVLWLIVNRSVTPPWGKTARISL